MRRLLLAITILAGLGIVVSSYGLWQHYAPLGAGFCNFNESFSCDVVNKSIYSEIFGIPVALVGIVGYAVLAIVGIWMMRIVRVSPPPAGRGSQRGWGLQSWSQLLLILSLLGLIFQAGLTIVELWWIGAYCPICIVSQVIIVAIGAFAFIVWEKERSSAS